jgi:hypothetical protein
MALAVGSLQYSLGQAPVTGEGRSLSGADLDAALDGPVADAVFDSVGTRDVRRFLEGLSDTEFEPGGVDRVLSAQGNPEDWRVGEGLAEVYLSDYHACSFPWPDSRDERKSGSSLPGADLVGLCSDDGVERFAFGEVKTSGDKDHPPGVVYGRTGMKQQMEDLSGNVGIRDGLVRYLAHRAPKTEWAGRFATAFSRYSLDNTDVRLYGVLVRDVAPHQDDLRVRVTTLAHGRRGLTGIVLLGLYLPTGSISGLGRRVAASRKGEVG